MNLLLLSNILSMIGAIFVLFAIKFRKNDYMFGALNFIGAGYLVVAAILIANIGFFILNVVWLGIGLKIFLKDCYKKHEK